VEALTASRWSAPGFQEPTQERKPGDGLASLPAATLIFGWENSCRADLRRGTTTSGPGRGPLAGFEV